MFRYKDSRIVVGYVVYHFNGDDWEKVFCYRKSQREGIVFKNKLVKIERRIGNTTLFLNCELLPEF